MIACAGHCETICCALACADRELTEVGQRIGRGCPQGWFGSPHDRQLLAGNGPSSPTAIGQKQTLNTFTKLASIRNCPAKSPTVPHCAFSTVSHESAMKVSLEFYAFRPDELIFRPVPTRFGIGGRLRWRI